ncbi:MAG: hypothetical protein WCE21_05820 [Candidatus Babeliales bacterium]
MNTQLMAKKITTITALVLLGMHQAQAVQNPRWLEGLSPSLQLEKIKNFPTDFGHFAAKTTANTSFESAGKYVEKNPGKVLGVTAATGLTGFGLYRAWYGLKSYVADRIEKKLSFIRVTSPESFYQAPTASTDSIDHRYTGSSSNSDEQVNINNNSAPTHDVSQAPISKKRAKKALKAVIGNLLAHIQQLPEKELAELLAFATNANDNSNDSNNNTASISGSFNANDNSGNYNVVDMEVDNGSADEHRKLKEKNIIGYRGTRSNTSRQKFFNQNNTEESKEEVEEDFVEVVTKDDIVPFPENQEDKRQSILQTGRIVDNKLSINHHNNIISHPLQDTDASSPLNQTKTEHSTNSAKDWWNPAGIFTQLPLSTDSLKLDNGQLSYLKNLLARCDQELKQYMDTASVPDNMEKSVTNKFDFKKEHEKNFDPTNPLELTFLESEFNQFKNNIGEFILQNAQTQKSALQFIEKHCRNRLVTIEAIKNHFGDSLGSAANSDEHNSINRLLKIERSLSELATSCSKLIKPPVAKQNLFSQFLAFFTRNKK